MEDKQLIKGCKKNAPKYQRALYEKYKDTLFVLSLKYCRNLEDAQDNLQDSFLEIFKNIKKYSGKGSFEGWMKRITINKAIDKYKSNIGTLNIISEDNYSEEPTIAIDILNEISLSDILALIQDLPNRYRLVFNLYELDDFSHAEIAKMLSISIGTSKSNLHRAKLLLKEKIEKLKSPSNKLLENHGN
ncbi:MAG: RNA polymerase sigma factor [Mangrovimonas sp.]|nr:RNA polymerase sigma factor [Mangrovimonas sp.]MCB0469378.1 RNA polymerase sigma factor [Flavobacteriaceae bacterium]MCB0432437.1 RNA polymerase sigma factor [Mangrovimonas sp.]MCB0434839.1 RNA polymerase sigma factor [Mangrovimonas sp.]MCB0438418.1 RNA polymerase sigma factor [Mangrovimonas sp.]